MLKVILFDVNETLLDIHAIEPELKSLLGKSVSVREWFLEVLQHTLVMNEVKEYHPFHEIAEAVLRMAAMSQGRQIQPDEMKAVRQKLVSLPPYADVKVALHRLKSNGLRLATLTNSSERSQKEQLANAGLADYFERTFSVDIARRFKPALETYQAAIDALGVQAEEVLMVAAHGWDVLGARKAGCRAALVARPGKAVFPLGPQPELIAENLVELAAQIPSA
jgi:2-haloacid dehalogenase